MTTFIRVQREIYQCKGLGRPGGEAIYQRKGLGERLALSSEFSKGFPDLRGGPVLESSGRDQSGKVFLSTWVQRRLCG